MMPFDEKDLRLLSDVLPNISSQLRSSMASVFAAANRIAPASARENDPALDQCAAVLTMSCHQILRLVGNLSAVSELVQRERFALQNDDIVGFCRALYERAEPLFDLCGVALRFSADCESRVIAFHAPMLERALLNLLSNALKFTPKGGTVSLRVRCGERFVQLIVSDTGCGIEPERLDRIFERYLDTERIDPVPHGLGVGLSLCRRIAQGHGGMLVAQSAVGEGATFTLSLPNVRSTELSLHDRRYDYAGGYDHVLMELSDALPSGAFLQKYLD